MARVDVEIEEVDDIDGDRVGVRATCGRCDHVTESFGQGEGSRRRCLALMRDECPNNEENFYVDGGGGSSDSRPADPVPRKWWEK